jgi:hypothetical protein
MFLACHIYPQLAQQVLVRSQAQFMVPHMVTIFLILALIFSGMQVAVADRGYDCDVELMSQVVGRLSDIQVRDFAMGTHNAETFDTYWNIWLYLLRIAPNGFVAPVACLFATLAYERGDNELAYRALDRATVDDPKYALTILLRRVFGSGWPAAAFAAMRLELHPKVTAGIFEG